MRDFPGWIDVEGRSLFSWVALPDGEQVRGAVVVATSFGREAVPLVGLWRRLAEELANAGLMTVRVDYPGTGDSTGSLGDPLDVADWVSSLRGAVEWVREGGVPWVAVVGMRLGTAVVGEALRAGLSIDRVVLWDPSTSGRHWIRENRALGMLHEASHHTESRGGQNDEFPIPPSVGPVMSAWRTWREGDTRLPDLVLRRVDRPLDGPTEQDWVQRGVRIVDAQGQTGLLEVDTMEMRLPMDSLGVVVDELSSGVRGTHSWTWPPLRTTIEVANASSVRESVELVGERRLLVVETESAQNANRDSPLVLFVTDGYHNHWGPARTWVEMARTFAAAGLRCARFDFSGMVVNGEHGVEGLRIYLPEWREDIRQVRNHLGVNSSRVVYVTFCSGAYDGLRSALESGAGALFAINPPVGLDSFPFVVDLVASPVPALSSLGRRARRLMLSFRWPWAWGWLVLQWLLPPSRRRNQLADLAARGTTVKVISCDEDRTPFYDHERWSRVGTRRIDHPRGYSVRVIDGLDHSMRRIEARRETMRELESFVVEITAPWLVSTRAEESSE
ncbi:MAG: hypothetical protein HKL87_08165 [Acidimicrobiaceae bacterium]|nr:hypothetical protein [Acidimicrobiaceae bacterium]